MKYILASQSPRRRELLARTGLEFEVIPSDVDEKITKEIPFDVAMELAHKKADNVCRLFFWQWHRSKKMTAKTLIYKNIF